MRALTKDRDTTAPVTPNLDTDPNIRDARTRLREARAARHVAEQDWATLHRAVVGEADPLHQRQLARRLNAARDLADEAEAAERDATTRLTRVTTETRGRLLASHAPERRRLIAALDQALTEAEQRNRDLAEFDRVTSISIGADATRVWGSGVFGVGPRPEDGNPGSAIGGWRRAQQAGGWL
jgi:hypothetical protein